MTHPTINETDHTEAMAARACASANVPIFITPVLTKSLTYVAFFNCVENKTCWARVVATWMANAIHCRKSMPHSTFFPQFTENTNNIRKLSFTVMVDAALFSDYFRNPSAVSSIRLPVDYKWQPHVVLELVVAMSVYPR